MDLYHALAERCEKPAVLTGLPTGLTDVDRALEGFGPGQLAIMAGRPLTGKTTLGLHIATHNALAGRGVLYVTLDLSAQTVLLRIYAALTGVRLETLARARLSLDEWRRIREVMRMIEAAPLYLEETPDLTLIDLEADLQALKRHHALPLVIIDDLQRLCGESGLNSDAWTLASIARGLKTLARNMDTPIVALMSLDRRFEPGPDHRPQEFNLRHLRVEPYSDVIAMLHREAVSGSLSIAPEVLTITLMKHRNGPLAAAPVLFKGPHVKVANLPCARPHQS